MRDSWIVLAKSQDAMCLNTRRYNMRVVTSSILYQYLRHMTSGSPGHPPAGSAHSTFPSALSIRQSELLVGYNNRPIQKRT